MKISYSTYPLSKQFMRNDNRIKVIEPILNFIWVTQQDVAEGLGLPYAAAKFLCHSDGTPSKKAFMRIYLQIPILGTQYQSHQVR